MKIVDEKKQMHEAALDEPKTVPLGWIRNCEFPHCNIGLSTTMTLFLSSCNPSPQKSMQSVTQMNLYSTHFRTHLKNKQLFSRIFAKESQKEEERRMNDQAGAQ